MARMARAACSWNTTGWNLSMLLRVGMIVCGWWRMVPIPLGQEIYTKLMKAGITKVKLFSRHSRHTVVRSKFIGFDASITPANLSLLSLLILA